jgi:hypothetical protein
MDHHHIPVGSKLLYPFPQMQSGSLPRRIIGDQDDRFLGSVHFTNLQLDIRLEQVLLTSIEETVMQLRQLLPEASRPLPTGTIDDSLFFSKSSREGI